MISTNALLASIAIIIDVVATSFYIRDVLRGTVKPHAFTWFIWFVLMAIAAAVSISEGAVAGGMTILLGGLQNFVVFLLAIKHGEKNITPGDKRMFVATLSAIPLWLMTKDPLAAALLVTCIDASSYRFTFKKTWNAPFEEHAGVFFAYFITGLFRIASMSPFTVTTVFYPTAILLLNLSLCLWVLARRCMVRPAPL